MHREHAVLVVDDHTDLRNILSSALLDEGYRVRTASDGAAALEQVELETFSVILLDMQMPVMDGLAFVRAYRSLPGHHAHLVVMTAGRDAQRFATDVGTDHIVEKPFDLDAVLAIVGKLAGRRS